MLILKNGYVKFNQDKVGTFKIDIPGENLGHTARLFPQPSCTCINGGISRSCHHILAIQIGFGQGNSSTKCLRQKTKNITIYRQRALRRIIKNAGKKVSTKRDTQGSRSDVPKHSRNQRSTLEAHEINGNGHDQVCS